MNDILLFILLAITSIYLVIIIYQYTKLDSIAFNESERLIDKKLDFLKKEIKDYETKNLDFRISDWQLNNEFLIRKMSVLKNASLISEQIDSETRIFKGNLNFNPKDIRFVGRFIDLVVFDGASEENPVSIYFLNILNKRNVSIHSEEIKQLILDKKYNWKELKL